VIVVPKDNQSVDPYYMRRKCAHPQMGSEINMGNLGTGYVAMAFADAMIAQKLMIETDEQAWLNVANNF
jgi:hypothetical protein